MPAPIIPQEKNGTVTVKSVRFSSADDPVFRISIAGAVVASYRNAREAKAHLTGRYMEAGGMDFAAAENAALFAFSHALRDTETELL